MGEQPTPGQGNTDGAGHASGRARRRRLCGGGVAARWRGQRLGWWAGAGERGAVVGEAEGASEMRRAVISLSIRLRWCLCILRRRIAGSVGFAWLAGRVAECGSGGVWWVSSREPTGSTAAIRYFSLECRLLQMS